MLFICSDFLVPLERAGRAVVINENVTFSPRQDSSRVLRASYCVLVRDMEGLPVNVGYEVFKQKQAAGL